MAVYRDRGGGAILFRGMRVRAKKVMSGVSCNSEGVVLFSQILERLEREPFAAPRLQQLVAELKSGAEPASRSVRRFARIVNWIDAYDSLIVRIIEVPLLYSVQTGFAAEAWRKRCGPRMRVWIDAAGEIEALLSLATYSFEHPADPFPEFADAGGLTRRFCRRGTWPSADRGFQVRPEQRRTRCEYSGAASKRVEHVGEKHAASNSGHQHDPGDGRRTHSRKTLAAHASRAGDPPQEH